jgi:16S rRNA (guanine527-N7)-methyltransferase
VSSPAVVVFGPRLGLAQRYADLLAGDGIDHGLLGPKERDRLWDRHLLNCAVVTDLVPDGARVVDVGSGAGLPGLAFAIRRGDLEVELVESLQRRTAFLARCVESLNLGRQVRVKRGRAEDAAVVNEVGNSEWVTARAVAPLDRLVKWCLPLLRPGGTLLAIKGARAEDELAEHKSAIRRLGGTAPQIVRCGADVLDEPAVVVTVQKR